MEVGAPLGGMRPVTSGLKEGESIVVNGAFMLRALWAELVLGRPLLVYEKGH